MGVKNANDYHHVLKYFPPIPEPAFETPEAMELAWGEMWGCNSEVGKLKKVLVHRPGTEMNVITMDKWDDEIGAIAPADRSWYWRCDHSPSLERMQQQHDAFTALMKANGVEVIEMQYVPLDHGTQYVNCRDMGMAVPGGLIVSRMGPKMRRGEEQVLTRNAAALGMPILRTINGTGTLEGGNFAFIDPRHVAVGYSQRTNLEGIRQLKEVLEPMGIDVTVVPMTGYALHLDGGFTMVDADKALVNVTKLPYFFLEKLKELKIECIDVHPDDDWFACNCLQLAPGKIVMVNGTDRTAERLEKHGVTVLHVDYDEIMNGGGALHCTTLPLEREYL